MTEEDKESPQTGNGSSTEGQEAPPPFEPDHELITYIERGQGSKPGKDR